MIKVLIADDIPELTKRFSNILKQDPEINVIECVHSGKDAVKKCLDLHPDVILMDVEMETRTAGLIATEKILEQYPEGKIVILTVYEDDETVFTAFMLGVTDYIVKNSMPEDIITCIKDAYFGCSPIRPVIARKIRREFQRVKKSEDSFLYCLHLVTQLTQTEIDVLELMSRGYTRMQICEMRCVELSTVKTQIRNILKKFKCSSMNEVIYQIKEQQIFEYIRNISGGLNRGGNFEK
ncbi:MAG: response regulator transcription factor [Eubacteriales bacterium]|nr:response regulator transcription factor [Eubacteriales bacterium]